MNNKIKTLFEYIIGTRQNVLKINKAFVCEDKKPPAPPKPAAAPDKCVKPAAPPDKCVKPPVPPDKALKPPVPPDECVKPPDKGLKPPISPDKCVKPPVSPDECVKPPDKGLKPPDKSVKPAIPPVPPVPPYKCATPAGPPDKGSWKIWRSLSLKLAIPMIFMGTLLNIVLLAMCGETEGPPFVPYEYMYRRVRRFPWGDGEKSLFHNPDANALPDGYEPGRGPTRRYSEDLDDDDDIQEEDENSTDT